MKLNKLMVTDAEVEFSKLDLDRKYKNIMYLATKAYTYIQGVYCTVVWHILKIILKNLFCPFGIFWIYCIIILLLSKIRMFYNVRIHFKTYINRWKKLSCTLLFRYIIVCIIPVSGLLFLVFYLPKINRN